MSNQVVTPKSIGEALDTPTLFRVAYLPFVMCEVVWDMADTVIDSCIIMRLQPTKKLCRTIRQLRTSYERFRVPYQHGKQYEIEREHREMFIDGINPVLSTLCDGVKAEITKLYGVMEVESMWLLQAVYSALAMYRALKLYAKDCDRVIDEACGRSSHTILPDEVLKLQGLLEAFAGDCSLPANTACLTYAVNQIYEQINAIEFDGLDEAKDK